MWASVRAYLKNLNAFINIQNEAVSPNNGDLDAELAALHFEINQTHDALVGMFVGSWARLEMSLDYANWTILTLVPGGDALAPELPRSLGQKITLFATAHDQLPDLIDFRRSSASIVSRIHGLKDHRHDLIHGRGDQVLNGQTHTYVRLHLKGGNLRHLSKTYTDMQLLSLNRRANALQNDASKHMGNLNRYFWPKDDSE